MRRMDSLRVSHERPMRQSRATCGCRATLSEARAEEKSKCRSASLCSRAAVKLAFRRTEPTPPFFRISSAVQLVDPGHHPQPPYPYPPCIDCLPDRFLAPSTRSPVSADPIDHPALFRSHQRCVSIHASPLATACAMINFFGGKAPAASSSSSKPASSAASATPSPSTLSPRSKRPNLPRQPSPSPPSKRRSLHHPNPLQSPAIHCRLSGYNSKNALPEEKRPSHH